MIVDTIRKMYEGSGKPPKGNPTGSRFGTCAAQSQMLQNPEWSHPTPLPTRAKMMFEEGDRVEAWWTDVIEKAYPNKSGLAQEPFYFRVPIEPEDVENLSLRITNHKMWGTIKPGFHPPEISLGEDGRVKLSHLLPRKECCTFFSCRYCHGTGQRAAPLGFIVDPDLDCVWAPTYLDRVLLHPDLKRLVVLEKKSMSNWAFRRAIVGQIDYGYKCQLAGMVDATKLDACWLLYRKETAHLAEIIYLRDGDKSTQVTITKGNGLTETYLATDDYEKVIDKDGDLVNFPGDSTWEAAAVWTPFDQELLEGIRERVRRVLLFPGSPHALDREYGPDFTCRTCGGTGTQTKVKGGGTDLKKPKPCDGCVQTGQLERAELSFPCSYCPVVNTCFEKAGVELTLDAKPHFTIDRLKWEASGLTFEKITGAKEAMPENW